MEKYCTQINDIKDTQNAFDVLKPSNKSLWSNIFWYILYIEIKYKCKNFLRIKWTLQKMNSSFFGELQLITVLLLKRDSYAKFVSQKLCMIFSIFSFVSFYQRLYFCLTKSKNSLTLKRHNSFQNKNNWKATHSFDPSLLVFKLQQEVLKFNDICVSCSSLKTDL